MDDMFVEDDYYDVVSLASLESCCRVAAEAKPRPKEAPTRSVSAPLDNTPAREILDAGRPGTGKR